VAEENMKIRKNLFAVENLQVRVRPVAKRRISGMAAVTDHHPFFFLHDMLFGGFAGLLGRMRAVTVRLVGGLAAGTIMFDSGSFIYKMG